MNTSLARMQGFDMDEHDNVSSCQQTWIEKVTKKLKVEDEDELTPENFNQKSILKETLAGWLGDARGIMCRQGEIMENLKEMVRLMKTEALADKAAVIRLQADLLKCKDDQLQSLQAAVTTTVQTTVKEEIKSFSAAAAKNSTGPGPVFSPDSLKKVVKSAIEEDDRRKNVMVFGLAEEEGELLEDKIGVLLQELGEKPRATVSRVGRKSLGSGDKTVCRPVKVTLASSTTVNQILMKTGRLKQSEQFKMVYVHPDMSTEERAARRTLVTELKKTITEQPDRQHYIRGRTVCSKDRG